MPGFDAIIVGSGMGAGAAGHALASAGRKVLFVERGPSPSRLDPAMSAAYPESYVHRGGLGRTAVYERTSRATYRVNSWIPVLGAGLGGSSAVYGGALLPFHPMDFKNWPFRFEALLPYYEKCDRLFEPRGSQDPLAPVKRALREPEPLAPAQRQFFEFLARSGKHPFISPIGYDAVQGCLRCFGRFCPRGCKRTAGNVLVQPALERFGAEIRYDTVVESLEIEEDRCVAALCRTPSGPLRLEAGNFFLGAGALVTPAILLRSRSKRFPSGPGNAGDQLGRNLMRHLIDFYFLRTDFPEDRGGPLNQVTCSDYYSEGSPGWGLVTAAGELMPPEIMAAEFVERTLGSSAALSFIKPAARWALRIAMGYLTAGRIIAPVIMEDEASPGNRIRPGSTPDDIGLDYRISSRDQDRLRAFRRELLTLFRPMAPRLVKVAEDHSFLAHACGTCRMGEDPRSSVTDPRGRVHGVRNLHVVDASLFPSSGAANPSLTVAACGMKVAQEFLDRQGEPT